MEATVKFTQVNYESKLSSNEININSLCEKFKGQINRPSLKNLKELQSMFLNDKEKLLWILARVTVMPPSCQSYDVFSEIIEDGKEVAIMTTSIERKRTNQNPVEICRIIE